MSNPRRSMQQVRQYEVDPSRRIFSATLEEIQDGLTSDVYFQKSYDLLSNLGLSEVRVAAEVFAGSEGLLAGMEEALSLIEGCVDAAWALDEGATFGPKEVVLRIEGRYSDFGIFETAILGALASSSGWATAARRIKEAAGTHTVFSFGARHIHPAVASVMDRAAHVGGVDGVSSVLGARLLGLEAVGTIPHALVLLAGDTLPVAQALVQATPPGGRYVLVDTFHDEVEEALRLADHLGTALDGVRLDTPMERGGVTPNLVRELRARLDLAGHRHVRIFCSGSLTPERVSALIEAGADSFGVGHYISAAAPIDMTMDLKVVAGVPVAKRGRLPGITPSVRLKKRI